MPYCPKCGKEVSEEDEYCKFCRAPLKGQLSYRHIRHRNEKDEKDEKDEKHDDDPYGAIIGGLIVIWLGALLFMSNNNILSWGDFGGGYFLMGIGAILMFRGLITMQQTGSMNQSLGYLIGGGVVALIGLGITFNLRDWWALLIIGVGLVIVYRGFTERRINPVP